MHIVIDAYDLVKFRGKSIGIYNYTKALLENLPKQNQEIFQITVLCSEENANDIIPDSFQHNVISAGKGTIGKAGKLYWDLIGAYRFFKNLNQSFDVYYNPRGFLPKGLSRIFPKTCITVHDLIPFYYTERLKGLSKLENYYVCKRLAASIKSASCIITDADATKSEIITKFRPNSIKMLHLGVDLSTSESGEKSRDYIFAMASTLPHKNLIGILSSYIEYCETERENAYPLIICGIRNLSESGIHIPQHIASRITTHKGIDEQQLSKLYANARVFLFLSHIEGFGYPPFEALKHGTPVIASDIPVFRELLGSNVRYTKLGDYKGTASAITDLCSSVFKESQISTDFTNHYSWKTHTEMLLKTLSKMN